MLIMFFRLFHTSFPASQYRPNHILRSVASSGVFCVSSSPPYLGSHRDNESPAFFLFPASHAPGNHEPPIPLSHSTHPPYISHEQVPISRMQRSGTPSIPPYIPPTPRYTSGFLPNQESPPVPRLRPASWVLPTLVDDEFENYHSTRPSTPADFRERSSGGEEDRPFSGTTFPPLITPHGSWDLGVHTASSASHTPSGENAPDRHRGNISTTSSMLTAPLTNCSNENYR